MEQISNETIQNLSHFITKNFPDSAIEICESLDLLVDSLYSLRSQISEQYKKLDIEDNNFSSAEDYLDKSKQIYLLSKQISSIVEKLSPNSDIETVQEIDENFNEISEANINYKDRRFDADSKIPHTLYEDFTYTRPAGVKIEETYLEATDWNGLFNSVCAYLYSKDSKIFNTFLIDESMRGRERKYFSNDSLELRTPILIKNSDIYSEGNVNAIFVRNIIIKMLEKYEISKRQCHIYIRRDFASIHNDKNKLDMETTKNLQQSNDEIKIGQYAKEYFTKYFQSNISKEEIENFTNRDWCHDTFGICYPILKLVDISIPIKEQVNYNNQYRRYYSNPILNINNNHYIICSQWYSSFKTKLISWINNQQKFNKPYEGEIEDKTVIKLGKEYSGIKLPSTLFVFILKTIEQYKDTQFETGRLSTNLSDIILKQTNYEKPHHVINNIRKYLEDKKIISLCKGSKKGRYKIIDIVSLQKMINESSHLENTKLQKNVISYNSKVFVYSYNDKKQIIIDVGNLDDEFVYLHDECVGKKAGEKFSLNSKRYVIISFKNKK